MTVDPSAPVADPAAPPLQGIGVCPGSAAGPVAVMGPRPRLPLEYAEVVDVEAEAEAAIAALAATGDDLERRAAATAIPGAAEVLEATAMIARDPSLEEAIRSATAKGEPAAWAVDRAIEAFKALLLDLGGYMAERVGDLDDVRDRTLARLLGQPMPGVPERDNPFILVADDLAPADTVTLTPERVLALVTIKGGPTSHTAILARSLGLPAVVACPAASSLAEGDLIAVDGGSGQVRVGITLDEAAETNRAEQQRRAARAASRGPGQTADGHRVALLLNIGDAVGAASVAKVDAEGVGLFRTEFLYLDRQEAPSVDQQVALYTDVLEAMAGRKIVVRTLDAGADKPLPFLNPEAEPNPALGVRGLRTARRSPDILIDQLEALAAAQRATGADVWVMAPMVATAAEAKWFTDLAHAHDLSVAGVMIEIPAAALRAADLLEHTDFLSIGTNDLAQYTLATDRMAGELADLLDPWQPALLDLIRLTAEAGLAAGKSVGVCGEAAASPALAPVLVGLGVTSLSMSASAVADVRDALAAVTLAECRELARNALAGRRAT
ncbi:MAG TPA: phosphoenolpyruvate--protein phosphotransferase [Candidatus Limnocylindrales bacterium]|jgi:phosphotransferase system enzyme I (PtsI)|nr:phosphoenolpyruvate--protein phosphotransferase [Candidatus Limnocylindrales bacterium]